MGVYGFTKYKMECEVVELDTEAFIEKIKEKIEHNGQRREIPSTRSIYKYNIGTHYYK